jgi:hypothetical protein
MYAVPIPQTGDRSGAGYRFGDGARIDIHQARKSEYDVILELRNRIYVQDQARLHDVSDMGQTFDKYNDTAAYFIARMGGSPIGAVKVVRDSRIGLPCEMVCSIEQLKSSGRVVEFGHLIGLPEQRTRNVGIVLMREALKYGMRDCGADYIVGDFFCDPSTRGLQKFYELLGFSPASAAYRDERFKGSPDSIVGYMSVQNTMRIWRTSTGRQHKLLDFFFHDYDEYMK